MRRLCLGVRLVIESQCVGNAVYCCKKRGDSDLVRLGLHRCCVSYHYTFMKYENEIHVDS